MERTNASAMNTPPAVQVARVRTVVACLPPRTSDAAARTAHRGQTPALTSLEQDDDGQEHAHQNHQREKDSVHFRSAAFAAARGSVRHTDCADPSQKKFYTPVPRVNLLGSWVAVQFLPRRDHHSGGSPARFSLPPREPRPGNSLARDSPLRPEPRRLRPLP